jgi:secreted trypsin-like serine protease
MRKLLAIVAALAALSGAGAALGVVGGAPDNGAHPYVGAALLRLPNGTQLCSGSLVSAKVFVTAAHCFPDGDRRVQVTFEENALTATTFYSGTVHHAPGFCFPCAPGAAGIDTNDLAVIVLDGSGAPQADGRYARLPAAGLADRLPNNQRIDVVGYGVSSFSGPGNPTSAFVRRVATTRLINGGGTGGDEFLKLAAGPGDCLGDSGGPDLVSGTDVMVAIVAYSLGNPQCNGNSYHERIDRPDALAFIGGFLAG